MTVQQSTLFDDLADDFGGPCVCGSYEFLQVENSGTSSVTCAACGRVNATVEYCMSCSHERLVWLSDTDEKRCTCCGGKLRPRQKWLGEKVVEYHGTVDEVEKYIPHFDRQPFVYDLPAIAGIDPTRHALPSFAHNRYYDVIIRHPDFPNEPPVPAGIVSKKYALVQHAELVGVALDALRSVGIDRDTLVAGLTLTEYGNRMHLTLMLPDKYAFAISNSDTMALRLECFNSVDGTVPLQVILGWFRFVCYNGMIVGTTISRSRQLHTESLSLREVSDVLYEGLDIAVRDKAIFAEWIKTPISPSHLEHWVDNTLREKWGVLAAARAYHIANTGHDGKFIDRFEKALPHARQMDNGRRVPGVAEKSSNIFDASQILSWLAKERTDIAERRERMADIPGLLDALISLN
ncbi:MAG: DUF932 domain-containing protein [Armatimonadota bacterium]